MLNLLWFWREASSEAKKGMEGEEGKEVMKAKNTCLFGSTLICTPLCLWDARKEEWRLQQSRWDTSERWSTLKNGDERVDFEVLERLVSWFGDGLDVAKGGGIKP